MAEVLELVHTTFGLGVVTDDRAAFEGIEDLGGMEAEDREVAVPEEAPAMAADAEGVRGVIDHLEAMAAGDRPQGVDVAGRSVAMHGQQGGRARGDGRLDLRRIEVEGHGVDVHEYGREAVPEERMRGRHEGERRGDDFALEVEDLHRGHERDRGVVEEADVFDVEMTGESLLQLLVERTSVGQDLAFPDRPQRREHLLQRR